MSFPNPVPIPSIGIVEYLKTGWMKYLHLLYYKFYLFLKKISLTHVLLVVKNPPANAGDARDKDSLPGTGTSPGEGNGNPLQCSFLENPRDKGLVAAISRVAQSRTWLKWLSSSSSSSQYLCLENFMNRRAFCAGYSPWNNKKSDTSEQITHTQIQCAYVIVVLNCLLICSSSIFTIIFIFPDIWGSFYIKPLGTRNFKINFQLYWDRIEVALCKFKIYCVLFWNILFIVVQSLSFVWLFATPYTAAFQAPLSFTISNSLLKFMSIESVILSKHLFLCCPLLFLPLIVLSITVFSKESSLYIRWPKYWNFSFSISPSNEYLRLISFRIHWFDLLAFQGTLKNPL